MDRFGEGGRSPIGKHLGKVEIGLGVGDDRQTEPKGLKQLFVAGDLGDVEAGGVHGGPGGRVIVHQRRSF